MPNSDHVIRGSQRNCALADWNKSLFTGGTDKNCICVLPMERECALANRPNLAQLVLVKPERATMKRKNAEHAKPEKISSMVDGPEKQARPAGSGLSQRGLVNDSTLFPIVGIGASAGGLAAFEAFFSAMPADAKPGMAFVLVQHLAPDHKSLLTDIIRRYTSMQVFEVEDGMVVEPNRVYIIPPGHDMALLTGRLHLLDQASPRGVHLPIDSFFHSLAQDQHERAICIVLSGTGADGTLGLRAIKAEGGMAMVQNPASTEYDGMPRSALATGLVDYELPPAEMPAQLIAYAARTCGKPRPLAPDAAPVAEGLLKKIFILLRAQTGHDFSQYKPNTISRRIERRMAVHRIENLSGYLKYLQQTPAEVEELFRDILIGVTSFFRDPEAFKTLEEQVIPLLFAGKHAGAQVRVWSAGCSTGEEAYSLAILLAERQDALKQSFKLQVFATDIDSRAIAAARVGRFPASTAADLSPERLARYFTSEAGGTLRIHKSIRDILIFSEQNVIKDPPFSKLDLICCRNLLIYLGSELQRKLIPLFHYALNPGGQLFLGTSETVGEFGTLFSALDRKGKLYRRTDDGNSAELVTVGGFLSPAPAPAAGASHTAHPAACIGKTPLRELTEQALLRQTAPTGALVNAHGDVLYLHGRSGMYLEPMPGEAGISNILKMAREGLRLDLTTALHKSVGTKAAVSRPGLRVKTNGHFTLVDLVVCPVEADPAATFEAPLFLVILGAAKQEGQPEGQEGAKPGVQEADAKTSGVDADARILALTRELHAKDEYLQSTNEELETSNEELKSANEELQSMNEELHSSNEELETSKEELQSVNEELATVNVELQTKVADLSRANNDMNNLFSGTGIATIFVDYHLNILRFTPSATQIINLIPGDVGRPVSHIVSKLVGHDTLLEDLQSVLATLVPREQDVQTAEGRWYTMGIKPYRTLDNIIEGAVLTFFDITEERRAKEALSKANDLLRLSVVVRDASDAITVQDLEGRIIAWNPGAQRIYGWSEAEALRLNVCDRIPADKRTKAMKNIKKLAASQVLKPYRTQRIAKDGTVRDVWLTSTALVDETGEMYAIATTERAPISG